MIHGRQVSDSYAHALPRLDDQRLRTWKCLTVERQQVEVRHLVGVRASRAHIHTPLVQHKSKITVHFGGSRPSRMNHDHSGHAHSDLRHLVMVRVIHGRTTLPHGKLVLERLPLLDGALVEAANPIHAIWQEYSVPVDSRRCGESIGNVDADALAFQPFEHWPMNGTVVAPTRCLQPRSELVFDLFSNEMEHLDPVHDLPRRACAVWNDYRLVVPPRAPWRQSSLICMLLICCRSTPGARALGARHIRSM